MHAARMILALSLPLAGCLDSHQGELGNLGFTSLLSMIDPLSEMASGDRVLAGTNMCLALYDAKIGDDQHDFPSDPQCFSETVTGPATLLDGKCWLLDTPGEVTWDEIPTHLEGCNPHYEADRFVVEVVAPSPSLRLGFDDWRLRTPEAASVWKDIPPHVVGLEPGQTIDDFFEDPGAPRRVVEGQLDMPMLRLDDALGRIYMGQYDVAMELTGPGSWAVQPSIGNVMAGERPLVLEPGSVAQVRAKLPGGGVLESPKLIAVPRSDAASLDLMVMLVGGDLPAYAHARVRDANGQVLHSAPVQWSVIDGALGVERGAPDNDARSRDYAVLHGNCEAPSESMFVERHATLKAKLGDLEDSVELTWIEAPEPTGAIPFEPEDTCMFGSENPELPVPMACSSVGEGSPKGPAWLAFAALLFVRSRRSRPTHKQSRV